MLFSLVVLEEWLTPVMTLNYVLITPARNEADYLERTIQSVVNQTVLPLKWVIVSDGSTDETDEIVLRYQAQYPWIHLEQKGPREERTFAGKAAAFNHGCQLVSSLDCEFIANLDADVSFSSEYFAFLLPKFFSNTRLGVAGTRYTEAGSGVAVYSRFDVAGQCQVFRRSCLEDIGGYRPCRYGGVDWMAVRMARMRGWETQTFEGMTFEHHRVMSSAERNKWVARLRTGRKDYILGNHPVWQAFRVAYQLSQRPYVVGSLLLLTGYLIAAARRLERPVSRELMEFNRREQMARLRAILRHPLRLRRTMMDS